MQQLQQQQQQSQQQIYLEQIELLKNGEKEKPYSRPKVTMGEYTLLVGFGLACAPVRYAHPSFWGHCHAKQGRCAPPAHRSCAASYSYPKNKNNLPNSDRLREGLYHRERILETSTLSCNEEEEEITKPPKR